MIGTVITIYQHLKELGYKINIHALFATSPQRSAALEHRAKEVIQVTLADAAGKAGPSFSRINDAYLKYGDEVSFILQQGDFWLGNGKTIKFATFNSSNQALNINHAEMMEEFYAIMKTELTAEEFQEASSKLQNLVAKLVDDKRSEAKEPSPITSGASFFQEESNDNKQAAEESQDKGLENNLSST